ncbi:MAG: hypothetical protein OWU84_12920 [Firmicutes bacterium]|nr:hypothetical protein [Bacillota bacterium]
MARPGVKLAFLLAGTLLGASLVQARTWQSRVDADQRARLAQLEAGRWHREVMRLKDQLAAINRAHQQATYVQTITLDVVKSPVPLIDIEVALQPYTETLLGMPLNAVKLPLLYHLLQDRRIAIGDRVYRVEVKALLVSPDVHILLVLTPSNRAQSA